MKFHFLFLIINELIGSKCFKVLQSSSVVYKHSNSIPNKNYQVHLCLWPFVRWLHKNYRSDYHLILFGKREKVNQCPQVLVNTIESFHKIKKVCLQNQNLVALMPSRHNFTFWQIGKRKLIISLALYFLKTTRDQDIRHLILAFLPGTHGDLAILTTIPTQRITTQQAPTGTHKLGAVKYTIRTKI